MENDILYKAQNMVIAMEIKDRTGRRTYQLYKVNIYSPCVIGGLSEAGFNLNFYTGKPSGACLTEIDILRLLRGESIEMGAFFAFKVN